MSAKAFKTPAQAALNGGGLLALDMAIDVVQDFYDVIVEECGGTQAMPIKIVLEAARREANRMATQPQPEKTT